MTKPLEELLEIAKSAKERADNAHEHICKLAKDGAKSWRLSIPVQDDDSDVLLQAPLDLVPQLSDAVIDLITHLKDAQGEIDWRNDNYYKLDDVNCKLNERIVKLEQRLKESYDKGFGDGWENGIVPWKSRVQKLEQRLAECETALKFYGDNQTWLYNEVKKSDCDIQSEVNGKKIPKGLEFESGGKTARAYLTKWGG